MYTPTPPPPVPPPKPSSHDASRLGTPVASNPARPVPDAQFQRYVENMGKSPAAATPAQSADASGLIPASTQTPMGYGDERDLHIPEDPGDQWLPALLEDKSKQDLAEILSNPSTLDALTQAPSTIHPSLAATRDALLEALDENVRLAAHLTDLEGRLADRRAAAQAQLLSTHALERQWRQKQAEMDAALAPFAPSALYASLGQSLAEQEAVCRAMEESFLEGGGGGGAGGDGSGRGGGEHLATERETLDWVRRYREAKKLFYLRHERRERWNEHRVGGWR
ncbi:hypothetical protein GGR53DRAFT_336991 [Hypoxylon sp. FL1150]|nr:hypothetical protein GGR53DRAFT_336991 [Hypoxylon sp. FL1150]